jgi:predicted RNA binding protein YcfA (HicA-like mRNA interferase family)
MSKREKLRRKLRNNPQGVTMQEVELLLTQFGFTLARVRGSHHIYEYEAGDVWKQIIVPLHGRKVKTIYVKKIVDVIDELFPEDRDEPEDENNDDEDIE